MDTKLVSKKQNYSQRTEGKACSLRLEMFFPASIMTPIASTLPSATEDPDSRQQPGPTTE